MQSSLLLNELALSGLSGGEQTPNRAPAFLLVVLIVFWGRDLEEAENLYLSLFFFSKKSRRKIENS